MILDFIDDAKPHYVEVKPKRFVIGGRGHEEIVAFIEDIMPVRKLFREKKLICHSQDGETGRDGSHCALCRDRYKCRKRLRLMLMVNNLDEKAVPAILEINQQSFDNLQNALLDIEDGKLRNTLVKMTVGKNEKGALQIFFSPLF